MPFSPTMMSVLSLEKHLFGLGFLIRDLRGEPFTVLSLILTLLPFQTTAFQWSALSAPPPLHFSERLLALNPILLANPGCHLHDSFNVASFYPHLRCPAKSHGYPRAALSTSPRDFSVVPLVHPFSRREPRPLAGPHFGGPYPSGACLNSVF